MDALHKAAALLVVTLAVVSPLALAGDAEAETEMDGLMLYQVYPFNSEGVAVHNYGDTAVDMADYVITDNPSLDGGGEGTLTFESITVEPGETLVIVSEADEDDAFCTQEDATTIVYGDRCTASSKFQLANSGDGVYLFLDGTAVDCVLYGSCDDETDLWVGDTVGTNSSTWIQRSGSIDTDSADDWYIYVAGQTHYEFDPDLQFDATVTPFLFPDSGGIPIYYALEDATESIRIEMYQLTSKNVIALLVEKAEAGVDVDVLLEGESLYSGTDPILNASGQLKALIDAGGEVRLIGVGDDLDRYDYDHAKYAVIDGDTVIVTSENWTTDNMNGSLDDDPYSGTDDGNRGWGVIVESAEYAAYMDEVFECDWSMEWGDVKELLDVYPNITASDTWYEEPESGVEFTSYSAAVTPVLSNDNSYEALVYYVSNASTRVYSQQQSLGSSYEDLTGSSPVALFAEAADRGVDARLIFSENEDEDIILRINASTNVKAATMTVPYVHNKGVICDDYVWVSSVNWTSTSFHDNREVAVVIDSSEVADFFAEAFLQDFDRYYTYGGFTAYISEIEESYESGAEVTFGVTVSPEAGEYTYYWDLGDGSDTQTTDVPRIAARPADGTHTLTVVVTDSSGNSRVLTAEYTVGESSSADDEGTSSGDEGSEGSTEEQEYSEYLPYIIIVIVVILFAAVAVIRSKGSGSRRR